ncbi:hypothetical protein ABE504_09970 [Paenibacillus oryzisoli]|uniref:hypothetical protein n=1 Tax=Paenibacillus oryzisoli TaxID=1850517 RepID=UPI003D2B9B1A
MIRQFFRRDFLKTAHFRKNACAFAGILEIAQFEVKSLLWRRLFISVARSGGAVDRNAVIVDVAVVANHALGKRC